MKKSLLYIALLGIAVLFCACNEDDLSSTSVVKESVNEPTDFDRWLEENYRAPFNIRFLYRYEDVETDMNYDLTPARELYCRILAKAVRYLWLDPYTEITNAHFMRQYAPRVMMVIGSGAFNSNGTMTVGTAEGGLKITLYVGNWIEDFATINYFNGVDETGGYSVTIDNVERFNYYYLHTIHHEFAHILNQKIPYPTDFNAISKGDYAAQWNTNTDADAAPLGFVSAYASAAPGEDFVEVYSCYVSWDDATWEAKLEEAGEEGADRIRRKLEIVKSYMQTAWNIDVEAMRASLNRRFNDISNIDWSNFN